LHFDEYVKHYTNAPVIIETEFADTEDLDGVFSGWNPETKKYDTTTWSYEGMETHGAAGKRDEGFRAKGHQSHGGHGGGLEHGEPPSEDPDLAHPRCVFQLLKKHYRRYTPEFVADTCGCSVEDFLFVCESLVENSGREKTSAFVYSVGWTQHTVGVQYIRGAAVIQQLLGNIGRPGGGILALRGHASIQGSTDIPTLYDTLPGYLPMPRGDGSEATLRDYLARHTRPTGLWHNFPSYFISLLKAYYGKNATAENDFGYNWVPKITGNHSFFEYLYDMLDGKMEGMFVMGQNPAVAAPNSRLQRKALAKLKWLVVREMVEIEAATFWRDSPEIERGELKTEEIETEVFLFPAGGHAEKEGAFTNTQRLLQWREKAVDPPGDARSDAWFMHQLALRLIAKAKQSSDPLDEPLRALDWWYPEDEHGEPDMEAVL